MSARRGVSLACVICWKAVCARQASACGSRRSSSKPKPGLTCGPTEFDGELKDVFEFQDQITETVVGIVEPSVQKSEIQRSRRKRAGRELLDAHDLYLRALPYVSPISPANAPIATEFLLKALELEPRYAAAHGYLAWAHQIHFVHGGGFDEGDRNRRAAPRTGRARERCRRRDGAGGGRERRRLFGQGCKGRAQRDRARVVLQPFVRTRLLFRGSPLRVERRSAHGYDVCASSAAFEPFRPADV